MRTCGLALALSLSCPNPSLRYHTQSTQRTDDMLVASIRGGFEVKEKEQRRVEGVEKRRREKRGANRGRRVWPGRPAPPPGHSPLSLSLLACFSVCATPTHTHIHNTPHAPHGEASINRPCQHMWCGHARPVSAGAPALRETRHLHVLCRAMRRPRWATPRRSPSVLTSPILHPHTLPSLPSPRSACLTRPSSKPEWLCSFFRRVHATRPTSDKPNERQKTCGPPSRCSRSSLPPAPRR